MFTKKYQTKQIPDKLALKTPKIACALDDFTAEAYPQISFLKGDQFQVLDDSEFNYWRVIHLATREVGMVPANLLEPLEQ